MPAPKATGATLPPLLTRTVGTAGGERNWFMGLHGWSAISGRGVRCRQSADKRLLFLMVSIRVTARVSKWQQFNWPRHRAEKPPPP